MNKLNKLKTLFFLLIALMVTMNINAQLVKVYKNGELHATYTNSSKNTVKVVIEDNPDAKNLFMDKFSVSATKQVLFTKSNLYWDGNAFHFEANQTDYPTSWNASHVGHFMWTSLKDYQSGNAAYMPYNYYFKMSSEDTTDKFWCGEDNPLTVDGISDLYVLTSAEWTYLIQTRTKAQDLCKYGVTVTNGGTSYQNCLIIAPDNFTGTLASSYTLDDVNNAGLVCLPPAGYRPGDLFFCGQQGWYCSATPEASNQTQAYILQSTSDKVDPAYVYSRGDGYTLRLVRGL